MKSSSLASLPKFSVGFSYSQQDFPTLFDLFSIYMDHMEKISLKSYVASVPTPGGPGEAGNINFFLLNSFSIIFFWYSIIRCKVGLVSQPSSQKMISRLPNFWSHRHTQWRRDYNGPYLPLVFFPQIPPPISCHCVKKDKKEAFSKEVPKKSRKKRIQIIVRRTCSFLPAMFWKIRFY